MSLQICAPVSVIRNEKPSTSNNTCPYKTAKVRHLPQQIQSLSAQPPLPNVKHALGDAHILGRLGTVVRQSDSGGHFRVPFTVSRMILDVTLWSSRGVAMSLQKLTDLGLSLGRFGDRRLDKRGRRCSDAWSCVRACACGDWRAGGGRRRSASGDFWPTPR